MTTEREMAEEELALLLEQEAQYLDRNKFFEMYPDNGEFARSEYVKHMDFFRYGATYQQRCFMGGNGTGKTWGVGAYEVVCHATGIYPWWWEGKRFDGPVEIWVCGDTRETVRDITQAKLIGNVAKMGDSALGTGMVPADLIAGPPRYVANTNKAADFVLIKHVSGGLSTISFKAYEQGRKSFQGTEKHVLWLDEEPPMDIYLECLMRTRTVGGIVLLTFTPLSGNTEVVDDFIAWEQRNKKHNDSKIMVTCGWDDVPHLDEEWKRNTLAATPAYLRDARRLGIPTAGIGKVYPVEEDQFVIPPVPLRPHWRRCFGFDHGYHNTACVWLAYDKDEDVAYLYAEYKRGEVSIDLHAMALKARGAWIPGVGDASAIGDQSSGEKVVNMYRGHGINMTLPDKSVDAGIQDVFSRLQTGRLKVFNTCHKWLEEFRMYSYDDKQRIKKVNDHLMDATRYGIRSGLARADFERKKAIFIPEIKFG